MKNITKILWLGVVLFFNTGITKSQPPAFDSLSCNVPIESLKTDCYACKDKPLVYPCRVDSFGLLGSVDGKTFYFGIYSEYDSTIKSPGHSYTTNAYNVLKVCIFESGKEKTIVHSIWQERSSASDPISYYYGKPEFVKTKFGTILHIYKSNGNGAFDNGYFFLRKSNSWLFVHIPDFPSLATKELPDDYTICRGSTVNLQTMTITFQAWKPDDPCCCPTGGSITGKLNLSGEKMTVIQWAYTPGEEEKHEE